MCRIWYFVFLGAISAGPAFLTKSQLPAADPAVTAQWIWHDSGSTADEIWLRKTIEITSPLKSATVAATADNGFTLFVNGKKVLSGSQWERLETADVSRHFNEGTNVLAVQASNSGGPAAFVLQAVIKSTDDQTSTIATDGSWRTTQESEKDWKSLRFDDSSWKPARVLGPIGSSDLPWSGATNREALASALSGNDQGEFVPHLADNAKAIDGFKLEKVFHVPRSMGSWVSLTTDGEGNLIASDQGGAGLYKIIPGDSSSATQVLRLPVDLSGAQGLLWAFDSLYAVVNGGPKSGLHRIIDSDGDGELDQAEHLMFLRGGGEHGPHAVILGPDKKSLFVCSGNHTELPEQIFGSRIPRNWDEDLLLPRRWDANGHAAGRLAPGGWICKVDPVGKQWEVFSIGYRNEYDIALNADGELFSYDADMEWDLGSPWYRPTRVVHATSGSEFGWRSGTGKWPTYYEDSLPPADDIGPGSPVGIVFGYGAKFPAKYQQALFILDWTYSTIYAVHLSPKGSSYVGHHEDFVTGQPLQVTDATVASDGALYFAVGGRGTQSALYRVTYVGNESTEPVDASNSKESELRQLRHRMESYHGEHQSADSGAVDDIFYHLGHQDRFIRYAARVALETRNVDLWRNRVLKSKDPRVATVGAIALARQGSSDDLDAVLDLLGRVPIDELDQQMMLAWLRASQLALTRLGQPSESQRAALIKRFDALYPSDSNEINSELVQLLVFLDSPSVVQKTLNLIDSLGEEPIPGWGYLVERHKGYGGTVGKLLENMPPVRAIHYAFVLRNQKTGWSLDNRRKYLQFLIDAAKFPGGNSYAKFISQFRDDALATYSPAEKVLVDDLAGVSLLAKPPKVDPPQGPGRKWTRAEALPFVQNLKKRNHARGRNLFHATQCAKCHRLGGEGGAIGPDLSTAGRKYPLPDLLDALLDPSKAISDQYGSEKVLTADGEVIVGRVVRLGDQLHIYTADADAAPKVFDAEEIESVQPSKISQMPEGLLDTLNEEELKDLVAYLLSGGNNRDKVYR